MMLDTLLAMDLALILTFVSAGVLLNLTPGADVMFATACGVSGGWRGGVAASAGIALGAFGHSVLAAIGISAALMAMPWAYDAIRYAGAAYLLFLAFRAWRGPGEIGQAKGATSLRRAAIRGFLTNMLNPKVALFVLAFLPQFTQAQAGPVWQQILILGVMFSVTAFAVTAGYGAAAGLFGASLRRVSGVMNKVTAIIFGGLAARLLMD